jgi:type IV pilus assembly protein PilO
MNRIFEKLASLTSAKAMILGLILAGVYYMTSYDNGETVEAQIQGLNKEIATAELKKKDTEATLKEEANMKEAVGKLSAQYAFISKKLPSDLKSAEMVRAIDTVATISGVSVKFKKPGTVIQKEVVEELPVDVTLEGTYGQIAKFIYHTSNLERLTRVLNFTVSGPDLKTRNLRFDGQVVSYKLAPEPTEKTADGKEPAR